MKVEWLDRRVALAGPYLTLCTSEEEYLAALKHCKIKPIDDWIKTPWADATVHHATNDKDERVTLVCIRVNDSRTPIEIAGLLVHEAVHIWQDYADRMGETNPGKEQEAYAIQAIAQELMAAYARRIK